MFRKRGLFISVAGAAVLAASVVVAPPATSVQDGTSWPTNPANNAVAFVQAKNTSAFCSGTLVSPNIVLGAGHCMEHPEPNPRLHTPYWQTTTKVGTQDWEQPGRFYDLQAPNARIAIKFGPNVNSPVETRVATKYAIFSSTDSVLLWFSNPVPRDKAIPVPVLTRTPGVDPTFWNAKPVTLVGNNTSPTMRSGLFRTDATKAAGPPASCDDWQLPNYMCMSSTGAWGMVEGDSGGPGFWADPAGQRWLVTTNGVGGKAGVAGSGKRVYNVRTSHRGGETANARFPDQQIYFDRILGAADIAFAQFNASGTAIAGSTQVAQGYAASATRTSTGVYHVLLPKVAGANTVIATAHGDSRSFCQARSVNSTSNVVECFFHAGQRNNTGFSILSSSRWADAHATINSNGTAPVVTTGRSPGSTQKPTVTRSGVGRYTVGFPGMAGSLGNVLVSALQGSGKPVKCSVLAWGTNTASVGCTAPGNVATDHSFSVLGARKDNLEKRSDMFAWAHNPTAAQYVVNAGYAQMNDGTPVADRIAVGHYRIRFNGAQNTFNGVFQATPYGRPDVTCGLTPGNFTAIIKCTGPNGADVDTPYVVRYLKPQN